MRKKLAQDNTNLQEDNKEIQMIEAGHQMIIQMLLNHHPIVGATDKSKLLM